MGNSTFQQDKLQLAQQDKLQLTHEDTPKTIKSKLKGCQPELLKSLCFSGIHVTQDILTHCRDLMNLRLLELDHCRFNPEINLEYHPILEVLILRFTRSKFLNLRNLRIKVSKRPYVWKFMDCGLIKIL
jgi:hypothetical protein